MLFGIYTGRSIAITIGKYLNPAEQFDVILKVNKQESLRRKHKKTN